MVTVPVSPAAAHESPPLGLFDPSPDEKVGFDPVGLDEAVESHNAASTADLFGDDCNAADSDNPTVEVAATGTAPTEVAPAESTSTPPQAEAVLCIWDAEIRQWVPQQAVKVPEETAFARKLREAEQEHSDAALEVHEIEGEIADLKDRLKSAKETHKACAVRLARLRRRGETQLDMFGSEAAAVVSGAADSAVSGEKSEEAAAATQPVAASSDVWRKKPITVLDFSQIKGLGKKKQEALKEACPTIGDLVDLYEKAGAAGIKTELPNGFGDALAQGIEDAMLEWLSANRDAAIFNPSSDAAHAATEVEAAETADEPADEAVEADEPQDREAMILARRDELADLKPGDDEFERIRNERVDSFENGILSGRDGDPLEATIQPEGPSLDAYILGYLNPDIELPPAE